MWLFAALRRCTLGEDPVGWRCHLLLVVARRWPNNLTRGHRNPFDVYSQKMWHDIPRPPG
eukprot:COSAG06_NODE_58256_length_277_cov_1.168539_2_plen_59_part_01